MYSRSGYADHEYMTTAAHTDICPDCEQSYDIYGTRTASLVRHMINAGHLTVGEAKAELDANLLPNDAREVLAGWVLHRWDEGDEYRAIPGEGPAVVYVRVQPFGRRPHTLQAATEEEGRRLADMLSSDLEVRTATVEVNGEAVVTYARGREV